MAWALRTGRKPRLSFEMGYHALEIVEGARISEEGENFYTLKLNLTVLLRYLQTFTVVNARSARLRKSRKI